MRREGSLRFVANVKCNCRCTHLLKWNMLGARGMDLNTLMIILLFAKHPDPDLLKMQLQKQPMEVMDFAQ